MKKINAAILDWDHNNTPYSPLFNDIYYYSHNDGNGLDEARHVYIHGNDLLHRWNNLDPKQKFFTIAEMGFGSSLNFLATYQAFIRSTRPKHLMLHYIGIEAHPFSKAQMVKAIARWPELKPLQNNLLEIYPPLIHGIHQYHFLDHNILLTLWFGDISEIWLSLKGDPHSDYLKSLYFSPLNLNHSIDAWYLDGFNPEKNCELWSNNLCSAMTHLSTQGATFSTFSAQSRLRKRFLSHQFEVQIIKGYGKKREMLKGSINHPKSIRAPIPWFQAPRIVDVNPHDVLIIGAGLAGCSIAYELSKLGCRVTVVDKGQDMACGASKMSHAITHLKPTKRLDCGNELAVKGFLQLQQLQKIIKNDDVFYPFGIHYPKKIKDMSSYQAWLDAYGDPLGFKHEGPNLYFQQGLAVNIPKLCRWLLAQNNIQFYPNTHITSLKHLDNAWHLNTADRALWVANSVVLANGYAAQELLQAQYTTLIPVRGQMTLVPDELLPNITDEIICHNGYIVPPIDNHYALGATYQRYNTDTTPYPEDQVANLKQLNLICDIDLKGRLNPRAYKNVVGIRACTLDRLPIVGSMIHVDAYLKEFSYLKRNAKTHPLLDSKNDSLYQRGLFVSTGYGSNGLLISLLSAQLLAAMVTGSPYPVCQTTVHSLHPARFLIRAIKKQITS